MAEPMLADGGSSCRGHFKQHNLLFIGSALVAGCDVLAGVTLLSSGHLGFFLLCLIRLFLLALGGLLAASFGRGRSCGCFRWDRGRRGVRDPALFSAEEREEELMQVPLAGAGVGLSSRAEQHDSRGPGDLLEDQRATNEELTQHRWKADLLLAACFLGVTLQSVYTGVQITRADSGSRALPAVALCATVFCMNLEFLALKSLVESILEQVGVSLPAIHEHPLQYKSKVSLSICSVCRERVGPKTGGYEAFQCSVCEGEKGKGGFTLCLQCYRKVAGSNSVQEGILRGDKGPKPMPELTPAAYLWRTLRLTAPFRLNFVGALICITISTLASVAMPNYQGQLINTLVHNEREQFSEVLATFVALSVTSALFSSLKGLTVNIVARQIQLKIRGDMFHSLIRQDIAFFDGTMTGQLTSRMTNDAQAVTQPVQQVMGTLLSAVITLVGGTFMCFFTSWRLTMLALTMIGPVIYITRIYATWSKDINLTIRASMADANATATESLRNIRTVRSFGADGVEEENFQGHLDRAWRFMRRDAYASAGVGAITGYVNFAAGVLVYWYGGAAVLSGTDSQLSIGNLVTFNSYWMMLQNSITTLNGMLNSLIIAASAAKRVFEVIDLLPDIPINDERAATLESVLPDGQAPSLEFRDVHFTYQMRPDRAVFAGLSFTIPAGSTAAFVGRSGCGKSTAMALLMRFYDPQQGQVLVQGLPLTDYNLRSFQRRMGVVSQETQIFARSVRENLTYGMRPEDISHADVEEAAQRANAHDFIVAMDRGYDSMLGEGGGRLSGGQKQRLSIARAFLRKPQLLLLDEATSALDTENERQIQEALDRMVSTMAGSCSVFIIAHRLSTVMAADRIIVIEAGRVHEQGSHEELLRQGGIYSTLVLRQAAKQSEGDQDGDEPSESAGDSRAIGDTFTGRSKDSKEGGLGLQGIGVDSASSPRRDADFDCAEQCPGTGKYWEKVKKLPMEDRQKWLQRRMSRVLQRALAGFGSGEVADALVSCMRDALEDDLYRASRGPPGAPAASDEDSEGAAQAAEGLQSGWKAQAKPHDSVAALFREVFEKSKAGSESGPDEH
ncbi:unnamed protein product [Polarella glacialis]|uniref:Bile salt export pump n=1 Tax=Polarella glacialis TaxID=89957 RepID=A0A813HK14_POLGL|nr:unnamed protein product [Polarella glacialis]